MGVLSLSLAGHFFTSGNWGGGGIFCLKVGLSQTIVINDNDNN